ncbi:MAG: ribosome silencing factor [Candidatus Sericytochromatia bacterium]|nr:ribosome silencing factor [Candidatus Sericytochromatia bacterium]
MVLESALDKKAIKTIVMDISQVNGMADYMMICTGNSTTHVNAIANGILKSVQDGGHKVFNTNGASEGQWVLLDLGNVIVHIMQESVRNFYTLEKLWNNGKIIYLDEEYALQIKEA